MVYENQDPNIQQLISLLGSKDGLQRIKAREALVEKGDDAVRPLMELLEHPKQIIRWESMKTLEQIGLPSLIPTFILKLEDEDSDIRWIAAKGLIKQGKRSIIPLLEILAEKSDSIFVLEGSHHVFSELNKKKKLPDNFHYDEIMPLLKVTSLTAKLELTVYQILKEMKLRQNHI